MTHADFSTVETWIFDLDNTLYPPEIRLFDQIETLMTGYVMRELGLSHEEADHMRDHWWRNHGTTLAGLIETHGIDPLPFLDEVHDIDLSAVPAAPELAAAITALPGRKIVYTNGSRTHARRVTAARGLEGVFDALYGIEDAGFVPKPERSAFDRILGLDRSDPRRAAMFEDDPRNLAAPKALGMRTVLVGAPHDAEFIDFHTDDLTGFLRRLGDPQAA